MTADRDATHHISSWLHETADALPDNENFFDHWLDRLPAVDQRRRGWSLWRRPGWRVSRLLAPPPASAVNPATPVPATTARTMFSATRLAAAAVIVALVGGFLLVAQPLGRHLGTVPGGADLPAPYGPARNGAIVAANESGLVRIDPLTGATVPLLEGNPYGYHGLKFSPDGRQLLFYRPTGQVTGIVHVMDADGSNMRELLPIGVDSSFGWAPDSDRIIVGRDGGYSIVDVETGAAVDFDLGMDITVIRWRPQHDQIILLGDSDRDDSFGIFLVDADGADLRALGPVPSGIEAYSLAVSPDGSSIAYTVFGLPGETYEPDQLMPGRVHLLDIDSDVDRELAFEGLVDRPVTWSPDLAFSPDGTRLLIKQVAEGPDHAPLGQWQLPDYRHSIVPIVGEGPVVVLGSEAHQMIGGPGGAAIFSPDGAQVLAIYSQSPVGTWVFDAATGEGELKPSWPGWEIAWQRLAP